MTKLTPKEEDFLLFVYNYQRENHSSPDTGDLKSHLHVEKSRVSDLKRALKHKAYLSSDSSTIVLTAKAVNHIEERTRILNQQLGAVTKPLSLPLLGEVKAGDANPDELAVYGDHLFEEEDAPTEPVPYVASGTSAFMLKVVGRSMEREKIFEGDYLIIERIEKSNVRQEDLIITSYLPWSFVDDLLDPTLTLDDFVTEYRGPVVKYCTIVEEKINGVFRPLYRLGWKKDAAGSEYTIRALDIQPKGRVTGVYRRIGR